MGCIMGIIRPDVQCANLNPFYSSKRYVVSCDMLRSAARSCLAAITFSLAACSDQAGQSLVGAWQIASDDELAGETMNLWFREYGNSAVHNTIGFTLDPSGIVTVERGRDHSVCCYGGIDRHDTVNSRRFRLTPERAALIRRMLARLRPETLSAEAPLALPEGCSFIMDGGATNGVTFRRGSVGGAFAFQDGCTGPGARRVRSHLETIMSHLPDGSSAVDFLPDLD